MSGFKDEMRGFKDEMSDFKDEMRGFKDEMLGFKDENRLQIRQMNIKWGEIAKKLGTITEDLVAPSIPRIVKEDFGLEVVDLMIRRKKKLADGRTKEYDAVAVAGEYVFVDSTRSTLDCDSVTEFVEDIQKFREFFPEYAKNKIVGILASLHVNEGILAYAGKMGFVVLSVGDEIMEVKNPKDSNRRNGNFSKKAMRCGRMKWISILFCRPFRACYIISFTRGLHPRLYTFSPSGIL